MTEKNITKNLDFFANIFAIIHPSKGESAALGHFSVSIFFWQVDNQESKNKYRSITV